VLGFLGITTIYTLMEGAGNLGSKLMPGQFLHYAVLLHALMSQYRVPSDVQL
jgi:hypothetical protein